MSDWEKASDWHLFQLKTSPYVLSALNSGHSLPLLWSPCGSVKTFIVFGRWSVYASAQTYVHTAQTICTLAHTHTHTQTQTHAPPPHTHTLLDTNGSPWNEWFQHWSTKVRYVNVYIQLVMHVFSALRVQFTKWLRRGVWGPNKTLWKQTPAWQATDRVSTFRSA